jgi:hypothetical protein
LFLNCCLEPVIILQIKMKSALIVLFVISSCAAITNALSCYSLELNAGKSTQCYIEENAQLKDLDSQLVGTTPKCTSKEITQGTTTSVNGSFCYMAVIRANGTFKLSNTEIKHATVLVERGTSGSTQARNCSEQCKAVQAIVESGDNALSKHILIYFTCGDGDYSNGADATIYKNRTEKFNCSDFKFISQVVSTSVASTLPPPDVITSQAKPKSSIPLWLIIVIVVVVVLLVVVIVGAVWMLCLRKKKSEAPGAHAAYRPQNAAAE